MEVDIKITSSGVGKRNSQKYIKNLPFQKIFPDNKKTLKVEGTKLKSNCAVVQNIQQSLLPFLTFVQAS